MILSSAGIVGRSVFSIGISRTSIRPGHIKRAPKPKQNHLRGFDESWGEQIWVHAHRSTGQCVYSHTRILDAHKALKQLPFNGKKTKPAKLRKDYWSPLALISFEPGLGFVGRSVMQKLREFRHVHELAWGDEILRDPETGRTRTKAERGRALCDQRANAIADMAAVLAGAGGGNKMWIETEEERRARLSLRPIQVDWEAVKAKRKLYDVTVWWDNLRDKLHAQEWSSNVRHLELADWVPPEMPYAEAEDVEGAEDDGVDLHAESTISKDEVRRPVVA